MQKLHVVYFGVVLDSYMYAIGIDLVPNINVRQIGILVRAGADKPRVGNSDANSANIYRVEFSDVATH